MKILLDPVYTHQQISRCATYYDIKLCGKHIIDTFPDAYVYCFIPDEKHPNCIMKADDLVEHERWVNYPMFYSKDRLEEIYLPSDELKNTVSSWSKELWDWDILLTTRNNANFWETVVGKRRTFPTKLLLMQEPYPIFHFKRTVAPRRMNDLRMLTSYMTFDKVYIQTGWEREGILEAGRQYLSPYYAKVLENKTVSTFPHQLLSQDVTLDPPKRNNEALQVIYTQKFDESQRKARLVMETIWYSFVQNSYNIRFNISTNGLSQVPLDDKKFIIFGRLPRDQFWEKLKRMDVFISWSIEEGMPGSIFESLFFGVIGIVRRCAWSEDLFGKDYFGLVDTLEEAVGLLRWIYENRDQAWEKFLTWRRTHFVTYVKTRGTQFDLLTQEIQTFWDNLTKTMQEREKANLNKSDITLAEDLDSSTYHRIDFAKRRPFDDELHAVNTPFYRRRDFWMDRVRLLTLYNWKDTREPGVLERKYR